MDSQSNLRRLVVDDFGREWARFDQRGDNTERELDNIFEQYFAVFPWNVLPEGARGADIGCGSGRWAVRVSDRVGHLICIDASPQALAVAKQALDCHMNAVVCAGVVESLPIRRSSLDFAYSLGVLHHVVDTPGALRSCVELLKPGAPFLVYLYYALDNRPRWFQTLWRLSDHLRRSLSAAPPLVKFLLADIAAAVIYFPLARLARLAERRSVDVSHWPLSQYKRFSFYTMRTDALDRLGTRLEKRYTREEVVALMESAGLANITVSDGEPFWCAVGYRRC